MELSIRFVFMIWFVIELKETFDNLETTVINTHNSPNNKLNQPVNSIPDQETEILSEHQIMQTDEASESELDDEDGDELKMNGKVYTSVPSDFKQKPFNIFKISKSERLRSYRKFYLHYGACSLVWFIYLPVLIFITSFVSELYRLRLVLSKKFDLNTNNKLPNKYHIY